jgi:predicted aspartyl protease
MRTKEVNMGRFSVDLEISNFEDISLARRGALPPEKVRRQTVRGVVDSGAAKLVLPGTLVKRLGLPLGEKISVRYADGRKATRRTAQAAQVRLLEREGTFTAVIEPKRETALVGAIVLEDLDLLVDCQHQRVIPRDPHGAVYEIE